MSGIGRNASVIITSVIYLIMTIISYNVNGRGGGGDEDQS